MQPVFDRPQFNLLPDNKGPRMYANVSNVMEVATVSGEYCVALAVPTGLFPLMQEVFKIPPEDTVTLSIDQLGEKYVFSLLAHGSSTLVDLWMYSEKSLPVWILSRKYIVSPDTRTWTSTNER